MTVTPVVTRTLTGPCMPDTDQDGILDIYEDINQDDNLADNDTDQDGIPNYMDPNDDGDGMLTKYEGAEAAGVINKPSEANCSFKKVKVPKSFGCSAIPRAIGITQQSYESIFCHKEHFAERDNLESMDRMITSFHPIK